MSLKRKEIGVIDVDAENDPDELPTVDEATAREVEEKGFKPMDINMSKIEQILNSEAKSAPSESKLSEDKHDRMKHYSKVGERRVRNVVTLVPADSVDLAKAIKDSAAGKVKGVPKAHADPNLINGSASRSPPIVCFSACFAMLSALFLHLLCFCICSVLCSLLCCLLCSL